MENSFPFSGDRRLQTGLVFRLLPYQILLIVIGAVNGIIDGLYASNIIGAEAMSAIGLYGPINHFLYAAGIVLVSGSQILYGQYLSKEKERIGRVFSADILSSFILSLLIVLILTLGAVANLTRVFVNEEVVLRALNSYICGQAAGIPALLVGQQLFAFLSLENRTKRTMASSIACLVVNCAANHLFVAVFHMGTLGLGLSTSLSMLTFLGILAWPYLCGGSEVKFSLREFRLREAADIVRLGYSGGLSRFVEAFRCIIVNALILRYAGSAGLSAFAATNSLFAIIWAYPFGLLAVERMLFSISFGEEDRRTLADTAHIIIAKAVPIMCTISAVLILCADPLTKMFYRDAAAPVYRMTLMGFRLMPLCMPLGLCSLSYASWAQVARKRVMSILLPIVDGAVGVVVCSFILIPILGMNGLYLANILNGFICCVLIVVGAWISLRRFPRNAEDLLALPEGFGVVRSERLDITVRDIGDTVKVSEQVIDFCARRGVDSRRAFFAGLCLEEMAGNVVLHGFPKDDKKHSLDIRVSHKGDDVILRLRDNCIAFNPAEQVQADGIKNVGIRLACGIAKEFQYQNILGLNVLMMKI